MTLKQWAIMDCPFPNEGPHPCVVISRDDICHDQNRLTVNVLFCTSWRQGDIGRPIRWREVQLDQADGLSWRTYVRCDFIYVALKTELRQFNMRSAEVSLERQRTIAAKINEMFKFKP